MTDPIANTPRTFRVPEGVPIVPVRPRPEVVVPAGTSVPLIPKDALPQHSVQLKYKARVKSFRMNNENDVAEYEKLWQSVLDGKGEIADKKEEYLADEKTWLILVRWVDFEYELPQQGV